MRRDANGNELPPPHTDEDYVPSPEADAPIDLTVEERRMLAEIIGGAGARPASGNGARRARSRVERAIDRAAERAWTSAMLAAGMAGNPEEAHRIAKRGPDAFRGSSSEAPPLPGAM